MVNFIFKFCTSKWEMGFIKLPEIKDVEVVEKILKINFKIQV